MFVEIFLSNLINSKIICHQSDVLSCERSVKGELLGG